MKFSDTPLAYWRAEVCVLPALLPDKRPDLPTWKQYETQMPTEIQVSKWFVRRRPMCIVAGAVSLNVEMLDFDCAGKAYEAWKQMVEQEAPGLVEKLVIESTPSGGKHASYRITGPVPRNRKLAEEIVVVADERPVVLYGKEYKPRQNDDRWEVCLTLIETRGEGGVFLCSPSDGYDLEQGRYEELPVLTEAEHSILIEAARALNEVLPEPKQIYVAQDPCGRPGDDFNERGDVREVLLRAGWCAAGGGENEYWRRPGKDRGWSATLNKNRIFYVFSTNAAPFESEAAYRPFSVYAHLEHNGDFSAAASALRRSGYGADNTSTNGSIEIQRPTGPADPGPVDPGPIPLEQFRVPGFVSEVMDHCLATAPYPNQVLAFCGALSLQAVLAGRKFRDEGDNRTNIYLLGLGYSSVGKDWPRKVNARILHAAGMIQSLGEKFASGEGIQDALFRTPSMLFQTDEIDGLLQSINKSTDGRYESILNTLLVMYSASNSIYPMRRKASKDPPGFINQPCLVVYGTAIPTHYYEALSQRLLTNGFFARTIIVESGKRNPGQDPGIIDPPQRVMETAQWWSQLMPGTGNLAGDHPQPLTVPADEDARELITESRLTSEAEYTLAESSNDTVATTVWGRVPEQIRKLALLHAISVDHKSPHIDIAAVRWATEFVLHHTRRMLFMAHNHVADNPFHADCLKVLRKLREAPAKQLDRSTLLKRMKMDCKKFDDLMGTLEQQGDVDLVIESTQGRSRSMYRLPSDTGVKEGVK